MSAPKAAWAERLAEVGPVILPKYSRVEDAISELARACGNPDLTSNSVRAVFRQRRMAMPNTMLGIRAAANSNAQQDEPDPQKQYRDQAEARKERDQVKMLVERLEESEKRQKVLDALDRPLVVPVIKPREGRSGLREATAVALASDWHVEEKVFPDQVGGRNSYNLTIAKKRAERFFLGLRWLIDNGRHAFRVRDLILWLGGDLISGYIHEELEESNECSPVEAIIWLQKVLVAGIDLLLQDKQLERIVIPCSFGNHGRITKKKRIKTGAQNSFEWLLYNWLQAHYEHEPRVLFIVDKSAHQYVKVYDWMTHYHHGDEVKYGGGVGGVAIPLNKRIPKWDRVKAAHFHNVGHFHTYMDLGRITTNGSLIGYSEYAMSFGGDFEPPQQAFYFLDSKRGKTMCSPIWVDDHVHVLEAA